MRIKVSDGDFILLTAGVKKEVGADLIDALRKWLLARGLSNVDAACLTGSDQTQTNIIVLSVNDTFEDLVLKGEELCKSKISAPDHKGGRTILQNSADHGDSSSGLPQE